ncbi:hypothetical protein Fmac_006136 [Flemingia macrophylla]|uniref:Uncharacterized protein n=1 Tax=Flemingia macrophylla TaxID=520843 RepID=A0ABD1NA98_9FABA
MHNFNGGSLEVSLHACRGSRQENLARGDGFIRAHWSFMQSLHGFPRLSPPFSIVERILSRISLPHFLAFLSLHFL